MVALFVILTIVAFLLLDAIVLWVRRRKAASSAVSELPQNALNEILPEPALPGGVFLAPTHLWVGLVSTGLARIGFDPLIRSVLGQPDWVDVPAAGTIIRKGQPLFSARWGNRSILFASPVEGTVQTGQAAEGQSEDGWVITLVPARAASDLSALPMAEKAKQWFSAEWARLRDFVQAQSLQAAPVPLMPDGGQPRNGWMKFEPDPTWDHFVQSFLQEKGAGGR
jgi:hypothetical protein